MIEGTRGPMATNTRAGLVAGLAPVPLPLCGAAVEAYAPKTCVALRHALGMTGRAGTHAVAGLAIPPMLMQRRVP